MKPTLNTIQTFSHSNLNILEQHDCVEPVYRMHLDSSGFSFCCASWTSVTKTLPEWRSNKPPQGFDMSEKEWKKTTPPMLSLRGMWFCKEAQEFRKTVIKSAKKQGERNYKWCNPRNCQYLGNPALWMPSNEDTKKYIDSWEKDYFFIPILSFDVDRSCQLKCPSCRADVIYYKNILEDDLAIKMITEEVIEEFDKGNIQYLNMNSAGDPLISPACLYVLDKVKGVEKFSEIHLHTNGLKLTENWWNKHENLHHMIKHLQISLDAGNQESYEKVRLGGKWETISENLKFIGEKLPQIDTTINLITQKENYKSIPEFIEIGRKYDFHCNITRLMPWLGGGRQTDGWYEENSVVIEPDGVIPELEEIIRSLPPLEDIRVSFGNMMHYIKHIRNDLK